MSLSLKDPMNLTERKENVLFDKVKEDSFERVFVMIRWLCYFSMSDSLFFFIASHLTVVPHTVKIMHFSLFHFYFS